ncbi:PREDICTED: uncharacterized protein LOC106810043 [Priapulus caudatus]|uniref:Uncharacterized protein LOC106810043 n=1 Tax=Priapulus caudatus TaxID=37621 RepID=A0ABM1E9C5_PRICU|nr:PREDICTED: uncharacterized protein LOC106810043 [Priapulus caudatus]
MTSIISNTALLEHCVIWLMVGKGVLLPVLLLVVDAEYRRYVLAKLFPCCCEADKVQEKSQLSTLGAQKMQKVFFGSNDDRQPELDTKEKVERHRSKRSAFPGVDPKVPSKRRQWKESIIRQQMPALYDYINEAFKALEDQQKLLGGGGGGVSQHPKSSAMRRSTSLDNVESRQTGQDSGYEDHMNGGYETDPGETGKAEVAASNMSLYRTADIAVVLDRPDKQGHRQVQLYQMTPDGDNVVRLFPNQSDSDSDNGTPPPPTPSGDGDADESAEQVYVIPVQNYGAMNVYKVNIADGKMAGLTADASAAAEPDSDTDTEIVTLAPMMDVIKAADKSPVAQNVEFYSRLAGATTPASSPAKTKTAVKKVKNPERSNRRESIKQAVKMALMTEYFSEDDPDSGHEATAERKPREIRSPPPAPPAAAQQQEEDKQEKKEAGESTGYRLRVYPPARPLPVEEVFAARAIQVSRPADAHREALVLRNSRRGRPYDFFAPLTPRNAQRTYPPPPYGAPKHARPPGGAKAPPAYPGRREAPADGALASSRPVMRRESINRALHVATLFRPTYHHSDTDLRPRNSQFADVLPSVYLDRGAANHRQAALRRMTIPEDMFEDDASSPGSSETGACSGTRAARNSLRRDPGPDLSLVAYF